MEFSKVTLRGTPIKMSFMTPNFKTNCIILGLQYANLVRNSNFYFPALLGCCMVRQITKGYLRGENLTQGNIQWNHKGLISSRVSLNSLNGGTRQKEKWKKKHYSSTTKKRKRLKQWSQINGPLIQMPAIDARLQRNRFTCII